MTPGTTVRAPDSMPSTASRATSLALSTKALGSFSSKLPAPATDANSVSVKPGHSAVTDTPLPASSAWTASENERTNALLAA